MSVSRFPFILALMGFLLSACMEDRPESRTLSLEGTWSCRLDPGHRGLAENWQDGTREEYRVQLPGTTHTNEIGPPPEKQWISSLTPVTDHVGPAWYWRDIELTEADCRNHLELSLERVCWESYVWLNGRPLGTRDSLVSTHHYDLSGAARPGKNRLVIMVDNSNIKNKAGAPAMKMAETEELVMVEDTEKRLKCGGHHTLFLGYTWNGITGKMEIAVRPKVRLSTIQIHPDIQSRRIRVKGTALNDLDTPVTSRLALEARSLKDGSSEGHSATELEIAPGESPIDIELELDTPLRLWSEHQPQLYRLLATLTSAHGVDHRETEFGLRELSDRGGRMAINGQPTFLRGTLEKFNHPLTGYPPTDLEYWMRIFGVYRSHGLNHVRFHSCCPPRAAFAAADRLGLILCVELPGCSGSEPDDPATLSYLQAEALRLLDEFGNHPSFCMLTMGNEILASEENTWAQTTLMERVARCREHDPRRWYSCTAHAYTSGRDDDYYVTAWPNGPNAEARHQGEPLRGFRWNGRDLVDESRFNTRPPETAFDYREGIAGMGKPVVTHEVGMWAVYPDISEIPRFHGVLKPHNLEIIRDLMEEKGTLPLADRFVKASGQLSLLLYKEEIESALRTPGLAGFQLLGILDHPPQGTSTVGILTALREPKGIISAADFRRFCGPTVPLARLPRRIYTSGETLTAEIDCAHFGASDLPATRFHWRLSARDGTIHAAGDFETAPLPTGELTRIGSLSVPLIHLPAPLQLRLEVADSGGSAHNTWDLWVYPGQGIQEPDPILWSHQWNRELANRIRAGETAILELKEDSIPHARRGCFTTLLWNPIMKRHHLSQTMGILCDPEHPALAGFPTEFHSNWQWWDVIRPSRVLDLDGMSPRPEPLIRMIDSFIGNHCLALAFEAKLGKGRVLVTSLDLSRDLENRPAARQLRRSLLDYVASNDFQPQVEVSPAAIDALIELHRKKRVVPSRNDVKARFDRKG